MLPRSGRWCSFAFAFAEDDAELALVIWLNRLLFEARQRGLILGRFSLSRANGQWQGVAWGAPWDANMARGTEVEGRDPDHVASRAE